MKYIQPAVTATLNATATIQSDKDQIPNEVASSLLTDGAAYQADE